MLIHYYLQFVKKPKKPKKPKKAAPVSQLPKKPPKASTITKKAAPAPKPKPAPAADSFFGFDNKDDSDDSDSEEETKPGPSQGGGDDNAPAASEFKLGDGLGDLHDDMDVDDDLGNGGMAANWNMSKPVTQSAARMMHGVPPERKLLLSRRVKLTARHVKKKSKRKLSWPRLNASLTPLHEGKRSK
jgi:hypothetical protein